MENPQLDDQFLKPVQIASILQISKSQAYHLMETEHPCVRFGSATVRVRYGDLRMYIEKHIDSHSKSLANAFQSDHEYAGKQS